MKQENEKTVSKIISLINERTRLYKVMEALSNEKSRIYLELSDPETGIEESILLSSIHPEGVVKLLEECKNKIAMSL